MVGTTHGTLDAVLDTVVTASNATIAAPLTQSVNRALVASDFGKTVSCTAALTLTVPAGLPQGFCCSIEQAGSGQVTVAAGAGVTLRNVDSHTKTLAQYAMVGIVNVATDTYNFGGATAA